MARFNSAVKSSTKTTNLAGGQAFKETPKLELVSILLTSFLKDKFYETSNETVNRLKELIAYSKDKKFVAKSAIYARTVFGMRSISHLVAGELVNQVKGEEWTKRFIDKVVYRPDDMTEILSYYLGSYSKPIPNALKKGLAKAFEKFNEYQIAKYRSDNNSLSLVDLVNLVHPKPTFKNKDILNKLMTGDLKSKDTWESKLTKAGQEAGTEEEKIELKKNAWSDLIKEKKLAYFAALRNIRNILQQAPELVDELIEILTNEELIKKSLVLPFRYTTALKEIEQLHTSDARKIIKALNKAVDIACANVPRFEGRTLVALDTSGSMVGQPLEIGALFGAILIKNNDVDFMGFSNDAYYMNLNNDDSVLTLCNTIKSKAKSGGTNFHSIFQTANKAYDRIIILSDMQGWMTPTDNFYCSGGQPAPTFNKYKTKYEANPKIYSFDLNGYGTLQFPEKNVYCFAGFSEKIFDIMNMFEKDSNALIKEIERIEL
jgi:60 kDa SS-A/Ro ribonucleoprotein